MIVISETSALSAPPLTALAESGETRLHPNYIWVALRDREQDAQVNAAFQLAFADGTLESHELKTIRKAGKDSGFSSKNVQAMIAQVRQGAGLAV